MGRFFLISLLPYVPLFIVYEAIGGDRLAITEPRGVEGYRIVGYEETMSDGQAAIIIIMSIYFFVPFTALVMWFKGERF